jgi:hypothetical protein
MQVNFFGAISRISISFDYVTGNDSWASDLVFWIVPGGNTLNPEPTSQIGGYEFLIADQKLSNWSFYGESSSSSGFYSDSQPFSTHGSYTWSFNIGNGYSASGPVQYNNVYVIVYVDSAWCYPPPQFTQLPEVQSPQSINRNLAISTFSVYDLVSINSAIVQFESSSANCDIQTLSSTSNYYAINCPQTISYSTTGTKTMRFVVTDILSSSTSFTDETFISLCPASETDCSGVCSNLQTDLSNCGSCSNNCTSQGYDLCCNGICKSSTALTSCGSCDLVCQSNQVCDSTFGCLNCGYVTLPTSPINEGSPITFVFNTIQTNQYYSAYIRAVINGKTITNSTIFTGSQKSLSLTFGGPGTALITYSFGSQGSSSCSDLQTTTVQVNDVMPQVTLKIPSKINTGQSFKVNGTVSEVGFWTRPSVVLSINGVLSTATCSVTAQSTLSTNTQYSFACTSIHMSSPGSYTIRAIANVSWGNQNLLSNYSQKTLTVGNNF